jgi:hypothetical protein
MAVLAVAKLMEMYSPTFERKMFVEVLFEEIAVLLDYF